MNIVFLTSEVVPFAKTGGLADVCGALPIEVSRLGHRCSIIMPAFRGVERSGIDIQPTDISFAIPLSADKLVGGRLLHAKLGGSEVDVWLIDQPQYFDRPALYGESGFDYHDNGERFTFFCRAAIAAMLRLEQAPDVVHCNDWQSGLAPLLLKSNPKLAQQLGFPVSVMTIHNMAYQGVFPAELFPLSGLDWNDFHSDCEFYGQVNFLKAGLNAADFITTVSPRYAKEIQTPQHGCGLDGVLSARQGRVVGITNGIDVEVWDPSSDVKLPMRYDSEHWQFGKVGNKRSLQEEFGLELNDDVPMIGLVGRLAEQKGWDLILPVIKQHVQEQRPTQWIILGSGDPWVEYELKKLCEQAPQQVAAHIGFHDALAHRIEAGSDLFVMPSHYEPCGLNQLYSLRYGTVPVVTATGGLADTVVDASDENVANQTATGFHLPEKTPQGLDQAIGRALNMRHHQKKNWQDLVLRGMRKDSSWRKSAAQYQALYEEAVSLKVSR